MILKFRVPYKCNQCGGINFKILNWHPGTTEFRSNGTWLYQPCSCRHSRYLVCGQPQQFSNMVVGKDEIYVEDILSCTTAQGNEIKVVCRFGEAQREIINPVGMPHICSIYGFYFDYHTVKTFPIVNNHLGKHDLEILSIIGNTLEHPELLK